MRYQAKNDEAARTAAGRDFNVERDRKNLEALERRIAERKIA